MKKPIFIVFEGGEAVGKSTMIRMLKERLEKKNIHTVVLRNPGTTPVGDMVRNLALDPSPEAKHYTTNAMRAAMMMASFRSVIERIVLWDQAQEMPDVILCDRWWTTTMVYQGIADRYPADQNIKTVTSLAEPLLTSIPSKINFLHPPTVLLSVHPEVSRVRRMLRDPATRDVMEQEPNDFHIGVHNRYLEWYRQNESRGNILVEVTSPITTVEQTFHLLCDMLVQARFLRKEWLTPTEETKEE